MFFWMDSNTVSSLRTSPATNKGKANQTESNVGNINKEEPYTEQKVHAHLPGVHAAGSHVRTKSLHSDCKHYKQS